MKTKLTLAFIRRLSLSQKPVIGAGGTILFEPNPNETPYIVFDSHQDSPVGFGVKVAKSLTFVLQRRVGKSVLKAKIGGIGDFRSLAEAQDAARVMAQGMKAEGRNPNVVVRERLEAKLGADVTVAQAFAAYREHLVGRATPAKDSTIKNFDVALRRLERPTVNLAGRALTSLTDKDVVAAFKALIASGRPRVGQGEATTQDHGVGQERAQGKRQRPEAKAKRAQVEPIRTAAEQTFRWATTAAAHVIKTELAQSRRPGAPAPTLTYNPFDALKAGEHFRSRGQLAKDYERNGTRNPLSLKDGSVGRFLDALWQRRQTPNNQTAADYLLLTLLWGTRRGEAAALCWKDRIDPADYATCSWVDLKAKTVSFKDTKNRTEHKLPLAPSALKVLKQRHEDSATEVPPSHRRWVFPARSKRAKQGHYLDSKAILAGLREAVGLNQLRTHDLRRTFGRVAEPLFSRSMVRRLLNHKNRTDSTEIYTDPEEADVRDAMARIELSILETSPIVARALLPLERTHHPKSRP